MLSTMVFDQCIRVEIVGSHLAAKVSLPIFALKLAALITLALKFPLKHPPSKNAHRRRFVLDLRALILACDDNLFRGAGLIGNPYRRVGSVDALPTMPTGAIHIDRYIF